MLPSFDQLADEYSVSAALRPRSDARARRQGARRFAARAAAPIVRPRSDWSRLDPDMLAWQISDVPNAAFVRSLFEARVIIEPEAAALVRNARDAKRCSPQSIAPSR